MYIKKLIMLKNVQIYLEKITVYSEKCSKHLFKNVHHALKNIQCVSENIQRVYEKCKTCIIKTFNINVQAVSVSHVLKMLSMYSENV